MQKPFLPWPHTWHPKLPGELWGQLFIQPAGLGKITLAGPQLLGTTVEYCDHHMEIIHQAYKVYFYTTNQHYTSLKVEGASSFPGA